MKLTKAEERRRWLASRLWPTPHGRNAFQALLNPTKADEAIVARWLKLGHAEKDEDGLIRLTDAGRAALGWPNE